MLPRDSYLSASIANISTLQPKLVHFSSCNVVIPPQELPNCGANALGSRQFLLPAHSVNTPGFQTMHKDVRQWVISFTIFYSRVLSLSSMLVHVPFFELRYTLSLKVGLKQWNTPGRTFVWVLFLFVGSRLMAVFLVARLTWVIAFLLAWHLCKQIRVLVIPAHSSFLCELKAGGLGWANSPDQLSRQRMPCLQRGSLMR